MSQNPLRGAMLGAGFFAAFQAESWRRMPHVRIAAIADPDVDKARDFAVKFGIPSVYPGVEDLLAHEEIDFVDIVTRPDTHLALTQAVASHGIPVICQKPMAPTLAECRQMTEFCRNAQVRLLIHENWRWQAWYREARRILDSGMLGSLFALSFRMRNGDGFGDNPYTVQPYFRDMPRFLLYETGIHFLDTFRYLGGEVRTVYCQTGRVNPIIKGEDCAIVQLNFESGAHGVYDANRITGPNPPTDTFGVLTMEGDRGSLRLAEDGRLFVKQHGQAEQPHLYPIPTTGYRGDSVHAAQLHYADCLQSGRECESEAAVYLRSVKLLFACYESARLNRPVNPEETE